MTSFLISRPTCLMKLRPFYVHAKFTYRNENTLIVSTMSNVQYHYCSQKREKKHDIIYDSHNLIGLGKPAQNNILLPRSKFLHPASPPEVVCTVMEGTVVYFYSDHVSIPFWSRSEFLIIYSISIHCSN